MNTKFVYLVWHNRSDLFWWTFLPQILRNAPLNWRCNNECCAHGFILHCSHFFSVFFFFSPPRVTQLKRLQRLVLRSVPSWDHAPSTVLGLLAARADNSCLVGGRASLSGWQHLSEPGASCQHLARNSWTQKKMTASRCINVASLPLRNTLGSAAVEAQYSVCVGVCVCVGVFGLGLLLSLSVSLHLSHDFPDSGSPGVSHLGHQLHSQVNCSSKWSAKQCRKKTRKKKIVTAMIHRRALITGAWQDQTGELAINKPMSGVRDLLEHLKWMKRIC